MICRVDVGTGCKFSFLESSYEEDLVVLHEERQDFLQFISQPITVELEDLELRTWCHSCGLWLGSRGKGGGGVFDAGVNVQHGALNGRVLALMFLMVAQL